MNVDGLGDDDIRDILATTRRIALVGASVTPSRASFQVTQFLLAHGYDVTPVNPGLAGQRLHDRAVAADLDQAAPLDMVDLFRASEHVGSSVDAAIRLGARTVWMQLGVVNEAAATAARAAGLRVVMDRCPKIEWARLGLRHPTLPRGGA
ncbi:CoA-binding protein [Lichenicoccus sp.]|uniref:CoA-binding protein n=1 Tax=Lichenicoccus sp. TaxID=2781899 RepID=UPI003D0A4578